MKARTGMAAIAAAMMVSGAATAYEAGDWIVRSGAATVDPREDSSALDVRGVGELPGTGVGVDSDTQLLLNVTYMLTPALGVELLAATPFEHHVSTKGLSGLGLADMELGTIKHLPPTLTLLWYPMSAASKWQPFIGAGVNYTVFFDEDVSSGAAAALGARNMELDDSGGFAFRAGMDYMVNDCWSLHLGAYYLDISTDASVNTALGTVKTSVDIDPWVYTAGLGYRF